MVVSFIAGEARFDGLRSQARWHIKAIFACTFSPLESAENERTNQRPGFVSMK